MLDSKIRRFAQMFPAWFFGLSLGFLAWSKAGASIFCGLAALCAIVFYCREVFVSLIFLRTPLVLFAITFIGALVFSPSGRLVFGEFNSLWAIILVPCAAAALGHYSQVTVCCRIFLSLSALAGGFVILQSIEVLPRFKNYSLSTTDVWSFSDCMAYALPVGALVWSRGKGSFQRAVLFFLGTLVFSGLLLSGQRAPLLGGLCALFFILIADGHLKPLVQNYKRLLLFSVIVVSLLVAAGDIWAKFFSSPSHLNLWKLGWYVFLENPWVGSGAGTFREAALPFCSLEILGSDFKLALAALNRTSTCTAHNTFLHLLATQGLFGFVGASFFLVTLIRLLLNNRKSFESLVGLSAVIIFLFCSITDVPFLDSSRLVPFMILVGLGLSRFNSSKQK